METTTHQPPLYWRTCLALMILLAMTWSIGYLDLGLFNLVIALAISMSKALLVVLLFMHVNIGSRVLRVAAVAGIVWLGILLVHTLADYLTRGWVPLNH